MKQVINYNPMLMMLYNLQPNILVLATCSNFDQNEQNLIVEATKIQKMNNNLNLAIMNLETLEQMQTGVYSPNTMVKLAATSFNNLDYFVNYFVNDSNNQNDIFSSIKSLLNVQKVVVNENLMVGNEAIDHQILMKIFGVENVSFIPYLEPTEKLSKVKNALQNGDVKTYYEKTTTHYQIKGAVVHGKELGRVLGFPTANIKVNANLLLKQGVYYVKVKLPNDETLYDGMSCYWTNEENENVIETYLFNFNKDIYDWFIELKFQSYIRDNVVVQDHEQLVELLKSDAKWVMKNKK